MTFATNETPESVGTRFKRDPADPDVVRVYNAAFELLTDATTVTFRTIPEHVADEMFLRVVRTTWDGLRQANGGAQPTQVDGQVVARVARDALKEAEPLLSRYVVMGLS